MLAAWHLQRARTGVSDYDRDLILGLWPDCPLDDLDLVGDWLLTHPDVTEAMARIDPSEPPPDVFHYATWADLDRMLSSITWAWDGWLPNGFLSMIAGSQEMGKSILALRIAGCYIMGWPWPDGTEFTGQRGRVVWAEGEAGQQLNLDRAKAWGLDLSKIVTPHQTVDDFQFENEEHRYHLWSLMAQPDVRLGVVDSLSGIHGGKEKDAEMQRVIKPFAELARDEGKPLIVSHHLNKPLHGQVDVLTLNRVRGSGTITQTARLVWGIDLPDPHCPDTRRLSVLKTNLGAKPDPLGFSIGETGLEFCDAPEAPKQETQADKAADMLSAWLSKGPMKASELEKRIEGEGVSWKTAKRVKGRLRIVSVKKDDGWYWSLPARE